MNHDSSPDRKRWEIYQLCRGCGWNFIFWGDIRRYRAAWEAYRDEIREPFIKANPGRRPYAEWVFEIVPQFGERRVITDREFCREGWSKWGILNTNVDPPFQEPERVFLERHGLLTIDERLALEAIKQH